jgi:hypothetical protein
VLLTWLSLLLTVPFNLSAFDEPCTPSLLSTSSNARTSFNTRAPFPTDSTGSTIHRLLSILIPLLDSPSSEGAGAAAGLARLFARGDGVGLMNGFLEWVKKEVDVVDGDKENGIFVRSSLGGSWWVVRKKLMLETPRV